MQHDIGHGQRTAAVNSHDAMDEALAPGHTRLLDESVDVLEMLHDVVEAIIFCLEAEIADSGAIELLAGIDVTLGTVDNVSDSQLFQQVYVFCFLAGPDVEEVKDLGRTIV